MRVTRFDQIEQACLTDVGVRRSHNQDNHAVLLATDEAQWTQRGHLFLVADGMGAHAVGEKASELAARIIPHTYHKHAHQGPASALRKAFIEANASIHACGQANREFAGMGTTTTALLLRPEGAWVGHVGDSRAYRIRQGVIEQLSYDHSLVWEYARLKRLDPDQVQDIPANVIHRCLGPEALVQVDLEGPHPIAEGDIFLLCSDGLSGQLTDAEMGAVASTLPPGEACRFMVDLANLRGGPDNITVLIVRIGSSPSNGVASPAPPRVPLLKRLPWWVSSLIAGTVLATAATGLEYAHLSGIAIFTFLLAAIAIASGLVGLVIHYHRERERLAREEELPAPRIHRSAPCRIEQGLLDRLIQAVETLRQRADEGHWAPDWQQYEEHHTRAAQLAASNDLVGSFREYCLALLPLTRALQKQRHKSEVFLPVWDKPR
jgi:serine/threonine protein phosphatase PrpC